MAKTVCKTNIRKALRKSFDDGMYHTVAGDWMARIGPNRGGMFCDYHVRLWNMETHEEFGINIGGCTCMTENIEYGASVLLNMYNERKAA